MGTSKNSLKGRWVDQ